MDNRIDYCSKWGALSVGMAKRGHQVISVDKSYENLKFLKNRSQEEGLDNIHLVQDDIKEVKFKNIADFAILNDVLEVIAKKNQNPNWIVGGYMCSFINLNCVRRSFCLWCVDVRVYRRGLVLLGV